MLVLAALLNFVGLAREGYGNTYYAAAVRSMIQNRHAFFFNSLDPAGFVTLDKPPLGFWLHVASAKVFGFIGTAPGSQPGGPGGLEGPGGVGENGNTGPLRLLNAELGPQVGWLLPLAVIGLLVAAWQTRRRG
ncbi:MAG: hypothetical protein NVS2B16_14780 [Chloroflexota bacterium]